MIFNKWLGLTIRTLYLYRKIRGNIFGLLRELSRKLGEWLNEDDLVINGESRRLSR